MLNIKISKEHQRFHVRLAKALNSARPNFQSFVQGLDREKQAKSLKQLIDLHQALQQQELDQLDLSLDETFISDLLTRSKKKYQGFEAITEALLKRFDAADASFNTAQYETEKQTFLDACRLFKEEAYQATTITPLNKNSDLFQTIASLANREDLKISKEYYETLYKSRKFIIARLIRAIRAKSTGKGNEIKLKRFLAKRIKPTIKLADMIKYLSQMQAPVATAS